MRQSDADRASGRLGFRENTTADSLAKAAMEHGRTVQLIDGACTPVGLSGGGPAGAGVPLSVADTEGRFMHLWQALVWLEIASTAEAEGGGAAAAIALQSLDTALLRFKGSF